MDFLSKFSISSLTGIDVDLIVTAMVILFVILIVIMIINSVKMSKLKKKYLKFMEGKDADSLEGVMVGRLRSLEKIMDEDIEDRVRIREALNHYDYTLQKIGLVKYDAFDEQGGNMSFSLCLLNQKNTGFLLNIVHSKEGCYTYLKEILEGKSVIVLSEEEKEALEQAIHYKEEI